MEEEIIELQAGGFVPNVPGMWGRGVLHVPQDGSEPYLVPFGVSVEEFQQAQKQPDSNATEEQPSTSTNANISPVEGIGG
jgi:hypothetical protein